MFLFQVCDDTGWAGTDLHSADVAVGMPADDDYRKVYKIVRAMNALAFQQISKLRIDFDESAPTTKQVERTGN
jgi:hypothetical protein